MSEKISLDSSVTKRVLPKVTFEGEMKALLPVLMRAMVMGVGVYWLGYIINSNIALIVIGIVMGAVFYVVITLLTNSREAYYLVELIKMKR